MDKKSVTTLTLKQINKHTVYRYIYRQRETSKFQIVQDLNMGLSTHQQRLVRAVAFRFARRRPVLPCVIRLPA